MSSHQQHFKITRPKDDYGPEVLHVQVSGRVLVLKRGDSETLPLDLETEEHYIRDLANRYDVEEVEPPAPKAPDDPGLAAFLAGGSAPTKPAPPGAPSTAAVARGAAEAKGAQSAATLTTDNPAAPPVKEA